MKAARPRPHGSRLVLLGFGALSLVLSGCASQPSASSKSTGATATAPRSASSPTPAAASVASPAARTGSISAAAWRAAAQRWQGTPYLLGGTDRRGIDCSAFAATLHREVAGDTLPRTTQSQWQAGRPVPPDALQPGDLVFFNTSGRGVSHVGVFLDRGEFAHASTSRGVMVSALREPYWAQRFYGARRAGH